jgi:MoxR-like ATPase
VQCAQALALLRGRRHAIAADVRDLAADVLRHRLVLSYDALSEGVTADDLLARVFEAVGEPPMPERAPNGQATAGPATDVYAA